MRQRFIRWKPRAKTALIIKYCQSICGEYMDQGFSLTLRQLYYQFVSKALIPNTEREYRRLGNIVSKARLAGFLDWDAIEDRGRTPNEAAQWDSINELVLAAIQAFRLPRWEGQKTFAELWVEKEALAGVLEPIALEYHVTLMVNKGYSSSSAMYESAQRLLLSARDADNVFIFYIGDLDPSGEDMVRDIQDRLDTFTHDRLPLKVMKLALTPAQVRRYSPPPNPTKLTDSRAEAYIREHGHECWEVDALEPKVLHQIISDALENVIDKKKMKRVIRRENKDKKRIVSVLEDFE